MAQRALRRGEQDAGDLVLRGSQEELVLILVIVDHRHDRSDLDEARVLDLAHLGIVEQMLELADAGLHEALVVLRHVVFGVLAQIAVLASSSDAFGGLAPTIGGEVLELELKFVEGRRREPDCVVAHRIRRGGRVPVG